MKNTLFSNGLAVVSLVTAGLVLTIDAKLQAHGHQHGDVFGRIMHKPKASSGSSSNITTIGAAHSKISYAARSGVAILSYPSDSVAVLPTATGIAGGPDCFGGHCHPANVTHQSHHFPHATPVPQLQLQALEVQDGQLTTLPSRRRNRYRHLQTSGKDDGAPVTEVGQASASTMSVKTSGTY